MRLAIVYAARAPLSNPIHRGDRPRPPSPEAGDDAESLELYRISPRLAVLGGTSGAVAVGGEEDGGTERVEGREKSRVDRVLRVRRLAV